MAKGLFITIEGGEGAGKSTLVAGLKSHLDQRGVRPLLTREPGGTKLGEQVRALVLGADGEVCAQAELLLLFAARAQLVQDVIGPALRAGRCVVCDRFVDASHAYQGAGRGLPESMIDTLAQWTVGTLRPDLTLLLDVPVDVGRQRIAGRASRDRIEDQAQPFFERVRDAYHARAAAEPERFCVIDASLAADEVLRRAIAAVDGRLDSWRR